MKTNSKRFLLATLIVSLMATLSACGGSETDSGTTDPTEARPEGCFGKCDGSNTPVYPNAGKYELNLERANEIWPGEDTIKELDDLVTLRVELGEFKVKSNTNHYGEPPYVLPYSDEDNVKMADGTTVPRRDSEIAKAFPIGEVGIVVKNHRSEHRKFTDADLAGDLKEEFKLQATHIEVVVGVERDGEPGAITINNPQTYQNGLFGDEVYRMDFLRIEYPEYVDATLRNQFMNNLRLHLMNFAAVSEFPGDYNGGDPLAAWNPEKIVEHSVLAVRAIAGDEDARAWFQDPANLIYCAELAHVSTSASVIVPLTEEYMVPLLGEDGQEVWNTYVAEVEKLNAADGSNAFSTLNKNDKADLVRLDLDAVKGLEPMWTYAPADEQAAAQRAMAFKPMTAADIVGNFLGLVVPRKQLGESVAPVQGALLKKMQPGLMESLGMDQLPAEDPRVVAVNQLFDAIVGVVSTPFGSYEEFQANIAPLMEEARKVTGPRSAEALDAGDGFFMPPSAYQLVALGRHPGGLLELRYAGHGVHWSAVQPASTDDGPNDPVVPPSDPDPDVTVDTTAYCAGAGDSDHCGGQAPEGCYCDDLCEQYNDCCADFADACN